MTNTEARQILIDYNAWRRGDEESLDDLIAIGKAIDAAIVALGEADYLPTAYLHGVQDGKRSKSSIAQAIRDAAVNWNKPIGESQWELIKEICDAFLTGLDLNNLASNKLPSMQEFHSMQHRTFMLLVAEALES